MKKLYPILVSLVVLAVGVTGCTDVGVSPKSSASAENVFSADGSYKSYLAKLYAGLTTTGIRVGDLGTADIEAGVPDAGWTSYSRLYWVMQEVPTDEAVITWTDQTIQDWNVTEWSADDGFNDAFYSRIFFQVSQVNEFLRQSTPGNLDSRGVDSDVRAQMPQWRAEARFLRALSYWHAIDFYGAVPIVTQDFPRGAKPPQQSSRQEVFSFIESELQAITDTEGEENLPPVGQAEYGRADKGAAYMLLAKLYQNAPVYIGENMSTDVVDALSNVISSPAYSLEQDYHDLFLADNHTSDELIFALPHDGQNVQSFGGTTFITHASIGGSANINPGDFGVNGGWFGLRTTPSLVDRFAGSDTRPVYENTPGNQFWQDGQSKAVSNLTNFGDGYLVLKYQNKTSTGEDGSDLTHVDTDFPMFRLADAYLMYAEAVARGAGNGSMTQAVTLLNDLRERAGLGRDLNQSDLTLDFLLAERSRELHWEAHRRTDLIRFGEFTSGSFTWAWKGGTQGGQSLAETKRLFPIPTSEILANPNMSQNEGY